VSCAEGDAALSSTLWSGGRTRAWTTHLAACTTCRAALARATPEAEEGNHQAPLNLPGNTHPGPQSECKVPGCAGEGKS
jgi:hypothetical protein